jgi:hypothetical protein
MSMSGQMPLLSVVTFAFASLMLSAIVPAARLHLAVFCIDFEAQIEALAVHRKPSCEFCGRA